MQLFMHEFPDAKKGELREQCHNTVLECEESMRVWQEMKDIGKLDSSDTDSEEEDKLTSQDLLQALDKASDAASPTLAPKAVSSCIDWPKRVLRQTILVSSIAAEIRSNIDWTDWDESCYKECRKLLQLEAGQIKDISEDRGMEEIPVLVDLEVQHWIAEALEGATHTLELVEDRITQIGVQCTTRRQEEESERVERPQSGGQKGETGCAGCRQRGPPQRFTTGKGGEANPGEKVSRQSQDKQGSCGMRHDGQGGRRRRTSDPWSGLRVCSYSPAQAEVGTRGQARIYRSKGAAPVAGDAQNALAERQQAAAQVSPAAPTTPPSSTVASRGAAAKPMKKKAKTKAAETSTGMATGA